MRDLGGDVTTSAAGTSRINSCQDNHHNERKVALKVKAQVGKQAKTRMDKLCKNTIQGEITQMNNHRFNHLYIYFGTYLV